MMTTDRLREKLLEFTTSSYPDMEIEVIDNTDGQRHLYFTASKFADLYPQQRYHYLKNLIPNDFYEAELIKAFWYELAPGEDPDDLDYLDDETIEAIKEDILNILENRTDFVKKLDEQFLANTFVCHGDFRHSKEILTGLNFDSNEQFDIFHVMMNGGGFCDCEILYNVFNRYGYAKKYWSERTKE